MGSKKSGILEKIQEGQERGNEGLEAGRKLEGEAREVKALLDSVDRSMDEDDVEAVRSAESGYQGDFSGAAGEQLDPTVEQTKELEGEASEGAREEGDKVRDAAAKFEQMRGVSEVGHSNAESASGKMESSAEEYEADVERAQEVVEQIESQAGEIKSSIDSVFGS